MSIDAPTASRLRVDASPNALLIEILPLVAVPRLKRRLLLAAGLVAAGTLIALLRLSAEWQAAARGAGSYSAGLLLALTAAVAAGGPLACTGILSLLFAEESLEVGRGGFRQEISVFGAAKSIEIPVGEPARVLWTSRPIAPWWTWTFRRLTIVSGNRRVGVGASLGGAEKRVLAAILSRNLD